MVDWFGSKIINFLIKDYRVIVDGLNMLFAGHNYQWRLLEEIRHAIEPIDPYFDFEDPSQT
jgi:hypothetical protein